MTYPSEGGDEICNANRKWIWAKGSSVAVVRRKGGEDDDKGEDKLDGQHLPRIQTVMAGGDAQWAHALAPGNGHTGEKEKNIISNHIKKVEQKMKRNNWSSTGLLSTENPRLCGQ